MKLIDKIKEMFDSVVILNLSSRKDRRDILEKQLEALGFPKPGTDELIRYNYTVHFPYNGLIASAFVQSKHGQFTKPNEYDCARNHYNIVKTCYELGNEHCLVLEDDILFMKDENRILEYLENVPEDYDILQFGGFTVDPRWLTYKQEAEESGELWVKHKHTGIWNCSMYALSRRGMEFYIKFMDRIFCVADMPLYKAPINEQLVSTYISREPVVIQANKDIVESDIRDKTNDQIDYEKQNVYEKNIDKSMYFNI